MSYINEHDETLLREFLDSHWPELIDFCDEKADGEESNGLDLANGLIIAVGGEPVIINDQQCGDITWS